MKVEVVLAGRNAYLEVEGKTVAVLYGITKGETEKQNKRKGNKVHLNRRDGFAATVYNAKLKEV